MVVTTDLINLVRYIFFRHVHGSLRVQQSVMPLKQNVPETIISFTDSQHILPMQCLVQRKFILKTSSGNFHTGSQSPDKGSCLISSKLFNRRTWAVW